jgi:hypothetical protein
MLINIEPFSLEREFLLVQVQVPVLRVKCEYRAVRTCTGTVPVKTLQVPVVSFFVFVLYQ